jgi:fatty acid desaturase
MLVPSCIDRSIFQQNGVVGQHQFGNRCAMRLVQSLSPEAKAQIKQLSGPRPRQFLTTMASTWLVIALAISAAIYFQNWFVSAAAIYVVATRQNLLALMIHEQTHRLGLNYKYGDVIVNLFAGYPLIGVTVEDYAKIHLRHHRSFFTPQDPDFLRKSGPDWTFPMKPKKLIGLFARDLVGISFVQFLVNKNKTKFDDTLFKRIFPSPKWLKPAYFAALAIVLTFVHGWTVFAIFWMLPLMTIFPAIVRWGAICEHAYGEEGAGVEETSPVILPTLLGRTFLPNMDFTMHVYHHYFPGVAFCNLRAVHQIFAHEGLVREDMLFTGHLDYLRFILTGPAVRRPNSAMASGI